MPVKQLTMAFRAAGCQTCRSRRIKCDGTRPTCQRCIKSGRACRGMPDGTPIMHMENAYASGKQKRPRGPRSALPVDLVEQGSEIPRRLELDLESIALTYYLSQHLQSLGDAPNLIKGMSDEVSPNWTAHSALPLLRLAVSSMALATFSRTQYHPRALVEASQKYHQVLRIAQDTLRLVDEDSIDRCLLVIFFMSRYEDAIYTTKSNPDQALPFTSTLHSVHHHDGAMATLNLWKNGTPHTRPASAIIKLTRRGLLRSAILRTIALPEWMRDGASFGERGLALEYDALVVRTISIRHELAQFLGDGDGLQIASSPVATTLRRISQEAKEVDVALQRWVTHFPTSWAYKQHVLPQSSDYPTEDFYSPLLYSYSSYAHAAVWNHYYAMRMLINNTRLKIPHLSDSNAENIYVEHHTDSVSVMETMADALAASIPFCLQKASSVQSIGTGVGAQPQPYVGSLTVWPLTIASSLTFLKSRKKAWFRTQLSRFGKGAGYGVLEDCSDGQHWFEL